MSNSRGRHPRNQEVSRVEEDLPQESSARGVLRSNRSKADAVVTRPISRVSSWSAVPIPTTMTEARPALGSQGGPGTAARCHKSVTSDCWADEAGWLELHLQDELLYQEQKENRTLAAVPPRLRFVVVVPDGRCRLQTKARLRQTHEFSLKGRDLAVLGEYPKETLDLFRATKDKETWAYYSPHQNLSLSPGPAKRRSPSHSFLVRFG